MAELSSEEVRIMGLNPTGEWTCLLMSYETYVNVLRLNLSNFSESSIVK